MNDWEGYKSSNMKAAKKAIWNPKLNGEWRPSVEIVDLFNWKDKDVVDFGCGIGRNIVYLNSKGCKRIFGYDYERMLNLAIEYLDQENCNFIPVAYPNDNKIPDSEIDIVFCSLALQHLSPEDLEYSLKWFVRVLKETGNLIIYGRDTSDPPDNIPVLPSVSLYFIQDSYEELPTKDRHTHSLSIWSRKN